MSSPMWEEWVQPSFLAFLTLLGISAVSAATPVWGFLLGLKKGLLKQKCPGAYNSDLLLCPGQVCPRINGIQRFSHTGRLKARLEATS